MSEPVRSEGTGQLMPNFSFVRRVLFIGVMIVVGWMIYRARLAFLLLFVGAVLAVVLGGLAKRLERFTPLGYRWCLTLVVLTIAGVVVGLGYIVGPRMAGDFARFQQAIPAALEQMNDSPLFQRFVSGGDQGKGALPDLSTMLSQAATMAGSVFQVLAGLILIIMTCLFLAVSPETYRDGVVSLFAPAQRGKARDFLDATGSALWKWLVGQAFAMLIIGVMSAVGLGLIGMDFALTLGIIAGLLQFIPYLGPILSSIPAILLAFAEGPEKVLAVVLLYWFIQFAEGNFITPMVLRREANLPAVLTLISTVVFTLIFGPLGTIAATPLCVILMVLYQRIYQREILGVIPEAVTSEEPRKAA